MRVHTVSLPHTETTRDWDFCAYTAKVRRFGAVLAAGGHDMILYAGTRNEASCKEHVEVVTDEDRANWFGTQDWTRDVFGGWDPEAPWWRAMNRRAIAAITDRFRPGDAIGIIGGRCQAEIAAAFPNQLILEWGCGYEGILDASHVCFESSAWRHHVYGLRDIHDGRFYDTVIPNCFDPADLTTAPAEGYLLFLGRHTARKGLAIVAELAKHHRVITAGQGAEPVPGTEHVGVVLGQQKAELLARASAVLVPTTYLEPFGGVAVEAMLSGVPVITTDFGAFTETVTPGVTGYRCSIFGEFLEAATKVHDLDRAAIREHAMTRWTIDAVAPAYDRWLRRLNTLFGAGWPDIRRDTLDRGYALTD